MALSISAGGRAPSQSRNLRSIPWKRFLRAPDLQLVEELYAPALGCAVRYDRCCAYFSSRVLAVAARGFGGLIQNLLDGKLTGGKPALRLIVNEQLDPPDLKALLTTGDEKPLIDRLLKRFKTPTEALEKSRLQMLAWLVAEGWLEVRVGLMRHTGGIVHGKFGIVTDAQGDRLAFMGSDNETGEALAANYEELELRTSWQDPEFTDHYQQRFETLWADEDDSVTTLPLPDAVRLKLIQLAPKQPPVSAEKPDLQALSAAILWRYLAAAPYLPDGEYACDATALVDLWPHQRRVVEDTARAFPAGRLLCDEVGMGKTIEAILVLRRLLCGRGVRRALLLVPAGLLSQWQDELREKGGLRVPLWDSGVLFHPDGKRQALEAPAALAQHDLLLLSREWARLEGNRQTVLAAPAWDLVLMDEAHAARRKENDPRAFNSANLLLQLLRELQLRRRARGILLLSGTPMQTQPWEPWDLLSVIGVGREWVVDFRDIEGYYRGVADLSRGEVDSTGASAIARLVVQDPEFPASNLGLPTEDHQSLADGLTFAFSEQQQQAARWLRKGAPLGRRMHRNTRDTLRQYHQQGLLDSSPAARQVSDVIYDYCEKPERDCYEAVEKYISARYEQLEREKAGKGFLMTIYHRRAASSPQALRRSLERRLKALDEVARQHWTSGLLDEDLNLLDARDLSDAGIEEKVDPALPTSVQAAEAEKREVRRLLDKLAAVGAVDSKLSRFLEVLSEATADGRAVLVFTEYTDTMEYLRDNLWHLYHSELGCYSGDGGQVRTDSQWQSVSKAEITERLATGKLRVLLCTDAASEGLNLQTAGALINYDLSWNPSKVEQRIGRIDRIGQEHPVLPIRNLFLNNSVDMQVYQALRERCHLFEHFVGKMQPVLALARDALRSLPDPQRTRSLVEDLERQAAQVEQDFMVSSVFQESEPEALAPKESPVTREDLRAGLEALAQLKTGVRATKAKSQPRWRVSSPGKPSLEVTLERALLEEDRSALPMTLGTDLPERIAERLPLPPTLSPLVLGEYASGPYRCVEARWLTPQGETKVTSAAQLRTLLAAWDGTPPSPSAIVRAQKGTEAAAKRRVQAQMKEDLAQERADIENQCVAAQQRLKRELARTLRCLGRGDLLALFSRQLQAESPNGRYHRALKLLGGMPDWSPEEVSDANAFAAGLSTQARNFRRSGPEIDAALNVPRWRVCPTLEK